MSDAQATSERQAALLELNSVVWQKGAEARAAMLAGAAALRRVATLEAENAKLRDTLRLAWPDYCAGSCAATKPRGSAHSPGCNSIAAALCQEQP